MQIKVRKGLYNGLNDEMIIKKLLPSTCLTHHGLGQYVITIDRFSSSSKCATLQDLKIKSLNSSLPFEKAALKFCLPGVVACLSWFYFFPFKIMI